jgi:hypothetical protein
MERRRGEVQTHTTTARTPWPLPHSVTTPRQGRHVRCLGLVHSGLSRVGVRNLSEVPVVVALHLEVENLHSDRTYRNVSPHVIRPQRVQRRRATRLAQVHEEETDR